MYGHSIFIAMVHTVYWHHGSGLIPVGLMYVGGAIPDAFRASVSSKGLIVPDESSSCWKKVDCKKSSYIDVSGQCTTYWNKNYMKINGIEK